MATDTFEGYIVFRTSRAIMFWGHFWEGPMFFPTSQVEIDPDGDEAVVIRVKDWLTRKRGIMEFTNYSATEIEQFART